MTPYICLPNRKQYLHFTEEKATPFVSNSFLSYSYEIKENVRNDYNRAKAATTMSMSIGQKIKHARKSKGLTQKELATALSTSSQAVTQWERNNTKPATKNLIALAKVLGQPLSFFTASENTPDTSEINEPSAVYQKTTIFTSDQIDLLREVIFIIEREDFKLNADQKSRLITSVFASCIKNNLTADDLTESLVDAALYSIK
ncbi:helix-turn-helix domain-containing protein [Neptunomonas phycophila]|uniref:helix-turn-helix domain-containing protein n=1 Tax=Neptunomonas phycophila TaxID=1572645 RepID=UPI003735BD64